jgi:hypothetical protein
VSSRLAKGCGIGAARRAAASSITIGLALLSLASGLLGPKPLEAEPGSETECLNFLAQARKALFGPLPVPANCDATNAYLPECHQNVQQPNDGFVPPAGPVQALGGVGGAGAVTEPFTPPGSPTQPGPTEATGTDRTN